jgi:hypothetical protein|tara:strand:+ start:1311 stop:1565 length:255 start_codon:yes stop_codon:yes gene_type:complete
MPKYLYHCSNCDERFLVFHLMSENLERREDCENECKLKKLPLFPVNFNKSKKEKKIGEVVNSHIEETKEDIRKQKEELRKNYNP